MTRTKDLYECVDVVALGSGKWQVRLDAQPAKTPAGNPLDLPTMALAEAIVGEWRAQAGQIRPETMALTRLANTAIDRVTPQRRAAVAELMRFAATDLLCVRAEGPGQLVESEAAAWDPLLEWLVERYGVSLQCSSGITPAQQHSDDLGTLESFVLRIDDFALAGIIAAAQILGSAILALALFERRIDAAESLAAAEVDTAYQQQIWGEDPELSSRNLKRLAELSVIAHFFGLARAV